MQGSAKSLFTGPGLTEKVFFIDFSCYVGIQLRNFIEIAHKNDRFLEICSSDKIKNMINYSLVFDKKTGDRDQVDK
jgi:hypothetical protein